MFTSGINSVRISGGPNLLVPLQEHTSEWHFCVQSRRQYMVEPPIVDPSRRGHNRKLITSLHWPLFQLIFHSFYERPTSLQGPTPPPPPPPPPPPRPKIDVVTIQKSYCTHYILILDRMKAKSNEVDQHQ